MRKKFSKFICVFTVIIVTLFSFTLPVSAETGTVYTIAYQQPQASNYDGYMEVLLVNPGNGVYQVYTYYWCLGNYTQSTTEEVIFPQMNLRVTSTSIDYSYSVKASASSDSFYFTLLTGYVRSGDSAYTHDYNGSGGSLAVNGSFWVAPWLNIVGVKVYGNGVLTADSTDVYNGGSWSIVYGGDNALYSELEQIKSILSQQSNNDIIANADKNANNIQSNADKNASQIQQNQDKNTDKILNGDSDLDSSGETGKVDGALGDIDGATNNAMGGKNEAQVKAEINNALDPDKIGLDFSKANRLSVFFDDTLSAFGSSYKSLLLLSLALGLGAFLIGRRYG